MPGRPESASRAVPQARLDSQTQKHHTIRTPRGCVTVRAQVRNYQRLQKLLDQWIEAAIELCELKIRQAPREAAPSKRA